MIVVLFLSFFLGVIEAEAMQNVTIESYRTQAVSVDENGNEEKAILKKATLEIYYYDLNGNKCILELVRTDDSGYIKNLLLSLPDEIHRNQLFFRYLLKNEEYGYLVDANGIQYGAITSIFIPENKTLDVDTTREFPNAKKIY